MNSVASSPRSASSKASAAVVFLIESHFTGRSALDSVTGKFGDAVAQ
jgi:hypothetical protein